MICYIVASITTAFAVDNFRKTIVYYGLMLFVGSMAMLLIPQSTNPDDDIQFVLLSITGWTLATIDTITPGSYSATLNRDSFHIYIAMYIDYVRMWKCTFIGHGPLQTKHASSISGLYINIACHA